MLKGVFTAVTHRSTAYNVTTAMYSSRAEGCNRVLLQRWQAAFSAAGERPGFASNVTRTVVSTIDEVFNIEDGEFIDFEVTVTTSVAVVDVECWRHQCSGRNEPCP